MKKTMKSAVIGLVFLFAAVTGASAGEPVNANNAELKFVKYDESMPVVRLSLKNNQVEVFTIVITDQAGLILHKETVKGENISRFYMLDKSDLNGADLKITVINAAEQQVAAFEIQNDTNVIAKNIK
jgi:hypothetical protein